MRQRSNGGAAEDLVSHCKDFSLYPEWISNSGAGLGISSLSAALRIDAGDKAGSREEEEAIAEACGGCWWLGPGWRKGHGEQWLDCWQVLKAEPTGCSEGLEKGVRERSQGRLGSLGLSSWKADVTNSGDRKGGRENRCGDGNVST